MNKTTTRTAKPTPVPVALASRDGRQGQGWGSVWLPCLYNHHSEPVWLGQIPCASEDQAREAATQAGRRIPPAARRALGLFPGAVDVEDEAHALGFLGDVEGRTLAGLCEDDGPREPLSAAIIALLSAHCEGGPP